MTYELTGRELDRACAAAIYYGSDIDHPEHPAHGRSYSTDAATLPEMLSWLRVQRRVTHSGEVIGRVLEIRINEAVVTFATQPVRAEVIGLGPSSWEYGATMNEAVARLVVAAAEAEAGAKR